MKNHLRSAFNQRQHMLSQDFEIFYYSDIDFRSVGSHAHSYYEFYFFVEGAVAMEIAGQDYRLKEGDMVLIPPGIQHRARVDDPAVPYRRFVLWISRSYVTELMKRSPDYIYLLQRAVTSHEYVYHFDLIEYNEIRSRLFDLLDEIHSDRFGRAVRIDLLTNDLLLHLNRTVYENATVSSRTDGAGVYQSLVRFIDSHLEEDLSLERLSKEFFLSKFYISHLFQETTGLSLHQYIIKKRLQACRSAIRGGASVGEACSRSGFGDYSSFYRAFKKEYGISPAAYQKSLSEEQP